MSVEVSDSPTEGEVNEFQIGGRLVLTEGESLDDAQVREDWVRADERDTVKIRQ